MSTLRSTLLTALLLLTHALGPSVTRGDDRGGDSTASAARRLEHHLVAPCCWVEPLDIHDSPLAHELRAEITSRLEHGEAMLDIERDLVERYGERIRAVPSGIEPVAAWGIVALGLFGLLLVRTRGRAPASERASESEALPAPSPELDARLARELAALDDDV